LVPRERRNGLALAPPDEQVIGGQQVKEGIPAQFNAWID
jgi:hypothetical protein